ncbi:MAG: class I adenylate-forming enzyme family protein [Sporichthyaceae bacterium]
MSPDLERIWGTEVVTGRCAGRPSLMLDPRPKHLVDLLIGSERWADREFLVQGERRIRHGEFRAAIPAAARILADAGVQAGDRVLLLSFNTPEFPLATWALWWLGAVPVYGNRWWSPAELEHALALTQPTMAFTDRADWAPDGLAVRPIADLAAAYTDAVWPDTAPSALGDCEGTEDDPGLILFTSGSSGAPKAVLLSRRSVIANQHNMMARMGKLPQDLDPARPQAVTLVCTPLFHIGGIGNSLLAILTGSKLVFNRGKFDPGEVLALIEAERVQSFAGVPTMAARLLEHPDFTRRDLSSLRALPMGGAPVPASLLRRAMEQLPQLKRGGLGSSWGMTESGGVLTSAGHADLEARPGTVGRPVAGVEIRIAAADESGAGELEVRAPTVMLGYLEPGGLLTEGVIDADGWLRTGDLGRVDADGYLHLVGRAKDIAIRGGENVACPQVEEALLSHPAVVEAAVFGIDHPDLGEEVAAVVRLRPDAAATAADLIEHARARLAYFAVPTAWQLVADPLPTLPGEKLDKKTLRTTFEKQN